jgi:hypothetical protein
MRWFVLEQTRIPERRERTSEVYLPFELQPGRINGKPAAFYTFPVEAQAQPNGLIDIIGCLWEHGTWLMEAHSNGLTREEIAILCGSLV